MDVYGSLNCFYEWGINQQDDKNSNSEIGNWVKILSDNPEYHLDL